MRRADNRGAAAIVLALITCFVMLPLSALAVDIGQQRVVRGDMQTAADTVALDMARKLLSGTTPTNSDAQSDFSSTSLGGTPAFKVYTGYIDTSSATSWTSNQSLGCGSGSHYNSYFRDPTVVGKAANAVLVGAAGSVKFSLHSGSGAACRSAIAVATTPSACFSVDSFAAQLNSGNSLVLNPILSLLGTNVNTTVLSGSGIATANVDLLSFLNILKANLGVGTVDQVLTTNVSAAQILTAEAQALTQSGTASAVVNALNTQLIANIGNLPQNLTFPLSSLIGLTQGAGSAAGLSVNAFDLATAALTLADGQHALTLSAGTPPSILGLQATATVIQKPIVTCGPIGSTNSSSQVTLDATGQIGGGTDLVGSVVSGVGNIVGALSCVLSLFTNCPTVSASVGPFDINAALATASGTLLAINCAGGTAAGATMAESASLAPITITIPISITVTTKNLLGQTVSTKTMTLTTTVSTVPTQPSPPATNGTFNLPTDYNQAKSGPSGNLSLTNFSIGSSVTGDTSGLLGTLFGTVAGLTNFLNNSVLGPIEGTVLTPLLSAVTSALHTLLGLDLAGSTYTVYPTANCGAPRLVG